MFFLRRKNKIKNFTIIAILVTLLILLGCGPPSNDFGKKHRFTYLTKGEKTPYKGFLISQKQLNNIYYRLSECEKTNVSDLNDFLGK